MNTTDKKPSRKALLLGHFSTVGDIGCLDYATGCLRELGIGFDTCAFMEEVRKHIPGCLSPKELRPENYTHLVFICGPCWPELLDRNGINLQQFAHCCRVGINTTMIEPVAKWNPFAILLERDSDRQSRPDLCFFTPAKTVRVVGLCLIGEQSEYGPRQRHQETIELIHAGFKRSGWARLDLDTRWPGSRNQTNIQSPAEFYSLVQKVDLVVTNRLHGLVLALKGGVPVLAVDSIAGGDKVTRQARAVGWPMIFQADELTADKLVEAAEWCVSDEGRTAAKNVAGKIKPIGSQLRVAFLEALEKGVVTPLNENYARRTIPSPPIRGRFHRLKGFFGG